jgi:hypothetical protein
VSVDTKKKETLGNKANVGREYRPQREPLEVDTHDFPDKELGKAIPYGVCGVSFYLTGLRGDCLGLVDRV